MSVQRKPIGDRVLERSGWPKADFDFSQVEDIYGMGFFDMDGTVTVPESRYLVNKRTIATIADFIYRGGICVVNTGATKERAERTFMTPLFSLLDERLGFEKATKIFSQRMWLLPENGSSILRLEPSDISIVENELYFGWEEYNPLHVPEKDKLRKLLEEKVVPLIPGSFVLGDRPGEIGRRNYILSLKGLKEVPSLIKLIKDRIVPDSPEIPWDEIDLKGARTTIDFINKKSGKEPSTRKLLEMTGFTGPIVGFGDLGDEFGKVQGVLTFNVNERDPNSFRRRGVAAIEAYNWSELNFSELSINNKKELFYRGEKIEVVRGGDGEIIKGERNNRGFLEPNDSGIKVLVTRPITIGGGEATAEILERLMDVGYFNREEWAS